MRCENQTYVKEGEEGREVELEEDTNMSDASIECFQPGLLLGKSKNCDKYLHIGQCNRGHMRSGLEMGFESRSSPWTWRLSLDLKAPSSA